MSREVPAEAGGTAIGAEQVPVEASPAATRVTRLQPLEQLRRIFIALEERDFRIFWLGMLVSVTGTWMQTVAQGWLVLTLTGSPFVLGLATAARSLPVMILAIPAGFVADRYDRRRIILATNVVSMAAAGLLGFLTVTDRIDIGAVLAIAVVLGLANAFEMPTRQSYVAELIGPRNLANGIALNSLLFNSARVVGPAIAGIIVALVGPGWAFLVNAISFGPVIVGLLLIRHVSAPRAVVAVRNAIPELLAYLRAEPRVTALLALLASQTVFASGHFILGPALANDLGQGAEGLGVLLSATGAGAIVGGLRLAATADRTGRWRTLLSAGLALTIGLIGVWLSRSSYAVTLLFFVVAGWGTVSFNATANASIQRIVPDRLRGRIMSLYVLTLLGLMPVAGLVIGALADRFGSATALGIGGVAYGLTVVAAFVFIRALRRV